MKPAVVIVGNLNMDFAVTTKRSGCGETWSGAVRIIGRVGQDLFADHLKAGLAGAGVDVSAIHTSRSHPTGVALIAVDAAGQNSIVVALGSNADVAASDVEAMRRVFKGARIALFQLEKPLATVAAALKLARPCARAGVVWRTGRVNRSTNQGLQ